MTIIVTRNASGRIRGFLASCMAEIAPGVYTAPRMNVRVRERVWTVVGEWFEPQREMAVVMTWPDRSKNCGQSVRSLGVPAVELVEYSGVYLARRETGRTDGANDGAGTA